MWVYSHYIHQPHGSVLPIQYRNIIPLIPKRYATSYSMLGLCGNPCATSLTFSPPHLFSFLNEKVTSLPYRRYLWGAGFTIVNTSLLMSECYSSLIASFHLNQHKCKTTLSMDFGSGPKRISAILKKKLMSTYVDFSYTILMNQYHLWNSRYAS